MGLILDTIIYSQLIFETESLSAKAANLILEERDLYITMPTIWEMANHIQRGIYTIDVDFDVYFEEINRTLNIKIMPISWQALNWLSSTPYVTAHGKLHKDTFDRMIIAHAITSNTPIVSKDNSFPYYTDKGLVFYHIK